MSSIEESLDMIQDKIIYFLMINEQYINEYIMIPFFYESLFHSNDYNTIRAFILSLLILYQILKKTNMNQINFEMLYLLIPFSAYIAFSDKYISTLYYTMVYNTNIYESIFVSVTTSYISSMYSFNNGYIFHVLYIIVRNNFKICIKPINNTNLATLEFEIIKYEPPALQERYSIIMDTINTFINNRVEPIREIFVL
jgi:hypothetical protein